MTPNPILGWLGRILGSRLTPGIIGALLALLPCLADSFTGADAFKACSDCCSGFFSAIGSLLGSLFGALIGAFIGGLIGGIGGSAACADICPDKPNPVPDPIIIRPKPKCPPILIPGWNT